MQKILFLHGFFASGNYAPANALKESFANSVSVLSPDLPLHPLEALSFIRRLCRQENPDVLVGNSNGAFLAQIIAAELGIRALLGNPYFEMTEFLKERIGRQQYKAPRADGNQFFIIDNALVDEFAEVQLHQWDFCSPENRDNVWGIFGMADSLAHYEPLFLEHYDKAFHFPGRHTPTPDEVRQYYVPLIRKLLDECK